MQKPLLRVTLQTNTKILRKSTLISRGYVSWRPTSVLDEYVLYFSRLRRVIQNLVNHLQMGRERSKANQPQTIDILWSSLDRSSPAELGQLCSS